MHLSRTDASCTNDVDVESVLMMDAIQTRGAPWYEVTRKR